MATGFLPGIFLFDHHRISLKALRSGFICMFFATTAMLAFGDGGVGVVRRAYAVEWYTVYDSGVLSGGSITNVIPDPPPTGFNKDVVQHPGSENITTYGSLISSGGQTTNGDDDAYVKSTNTVIFPFNVQETLNNPGLILVTACGNLLDGTQTLDTANIYKTSYGCFNGAMNSASVYNLTADGLAVIVVDGSVGSGTINIKATKAISPNKRVLVVTDAKIEIDDTAGSLASSLLFDSIENIQMGIVSTATGGSSFVVEENTSNAVIIEGPVVSGGDMTLGRNLTVGYPGVYMRYKPFYVAELSKKGTAGLAIKGLLESKTTWRYD